MNQFILLLFYFNSFLIGLKFQSDPDYELDHTITLHSPCHSNYGYGYCVHERKCCDVEYHYQNYENYGNCTNEWLCCTGHIRCQACQDGYRKENNTCVDINECDVHGVCSGHKCFNTIGGYDCECFDGFEMIGALKTCKHINQTEINDLILTASLTINLMTLSTANAEINESNIKMLYSGTVFPKSVDYSFNGNYMAWTDIILRQITIAPLNYKNPSLIMNEKVLSNLKNPNKLSIDWTHDLIYWTDLDTRCINVLNILKPEDYYTLINTTNNIPNDLIVNVLDKCLIWSYSNRKSRIMRSNQDGTQVIQLYAGDKYIDHLTIDITLKKYFFIDIEDSTLYSIDFKGNDERKHFQSKSLFIGIKSALIYDVHIFLLTDWLFFSLNKFNLNEFFTTNLHIFHNFKDLLDFKIIDQKLQPKIENRCPKLKCSHMCLPSDETQLFRCLCPQKYFLVNKTVCVQKKFENLILESTEWEKDLQLLINQSISKSFDLRKLFNRSIDKPISDTEDINNKTGEQAILILILITILAHLIILLIIGFKLNIFRMKTEFKYWSQMKALYHKTENNSIETIN